MNLRNRNPRSADSLVRAKTAPRAVALHPQIRSVYRALKQECGLECQLLETSPASERLAIDQAVACRLLALGKALRHQPNATVGAWLSRIEWEALWCYIHQLVTPPRTAPTVRRTVEWIAQLGGCEEWRGDESDSVALWRGLHRLNDFAAMWRLCRDQNGRTK